MAPLLGLSFYLATMGFESSNDLEFGMAVINVLPSDGKVIDEGPVGCSVDVCCDDFRYLDIGLPPEILRLKDAGYLTQAVAACDRLLEQNPEPSLAACVRAERYRMIETPLHFSVSRDRAIEMIREEWPEFTDEQFDDLIDRKRIDCRFIDGELFVLDNFLDSFARVSQGGSGSASRFCGWNYAAQPDARGDGVTGRAVSRPSRLRHAYLSPVLWRGRPFARGFPLPPPAASSPRSRYLI